MKKFRTLRLDSNTRFLDKATRLSGTLTHWLCDMDHAFEYIFQPKGLNEDGQPLPYIQLELSRLEVSEDMFEEVDIPVEILGTQITDNPSGFTGMAVEFVRHVNGCFHVVIQPAGILEKTKMPVKKRDFDLRQCSGEMITKMTAEELKASKKDKPSPTGNVFRDDLPSCCSASSFWE